MINIYSIVHHEIVKKISNKDFINDKEYNDLIETLGIAVTIIESTNKNSKLKLDDVYYSFYKAIIEMLKTERTTVFDSIIDKIESIEVQDELKTLENI